MKLFNFYSREHVKEEPSDWLLPNFSAHVNKSINLVKETHESIEDAELIELFIKNGIEHLEAIEIIFLPIAFVRNMLPNIRWLVTYLEYKDTENYIERKYSDTLSYVKIREVADDDFKNSPDSNTIIKIAGRSEEFKSINKALIDFPNTSLNELKVTKTVVIR